MRYVLWISGLLLFASPSFAQNQTIQIEVSADTIYMDNAFRLIVKVTNGELKGIINPPTPEACDLLQGPGRSSSMSIINGVRTSEEMLSYYFRPTRPGKVHIPEVELQIDDSVFKTSTMEITILPNPEGWHQDPNTGMIEGQSQRKKHTAKRKRYRI